MTATGERRRQASGADSATAPRATQPTECRHGTSVTKSER
ncbi:hypothetical protein MILU53160_04155 [Micrococcus luteus]